MSSWEFVGYQLFRCKKCKNLADQAELIKITGNEEYYFDAECPFCGKENENEIH